MLIIKNCSIEIVKGDITELKADAIVNAANNLLEMGGGVAGAIKRKGGASIEQEAMAKGPIKIGDVIYTKAGNLPAKFVIHAATMGMDFQTDENKIRNAAASSLIVADKLKLESIAIPALGCGVGKFSKTGAAKILSQEILKFAKHNKNTSLKTIVICLNDEETFNVFYNNVHGYITHFKDNLGDGPYVTVDTIIEMDDSIVVIERSNPPYGFALPGGFVDYGETVEIAAARETKEETNLDVEDLKQFRVYSDPNRDPRFHTVGVVFTAKGKGVPKSGDDAKALRLVKKSELMTYDFAFDHKKIIDDYLNSRRSL